MTGTFSLGLKWLATCLAAVGPFTLAVLNGLRPESPMSLLAAYGFGFVTFFVLMAAGWAAGFVVLFGLTKIAFTSRIVECPLWIYVPFGFLAGYAIGIAVFASGHSFVI